MGEERRQALSVDAQRVLVQWLSFRVGTNAATSLSLVQSGDAAALAEPLLPLLRNLCSPHIQSTEGGPSALQFLLEWYYGTRCGCTQFKLDIDPTGADNWTVCQLSFGTDLVQGRQLELRSDFSALEVMQLVAMALQQQVCFESGLQTGQLDLSRTATQPLSAQFASVAQSSSITSLDLSHNCLCDLAVPLPPGLTSLVLSHNRFSKLQGAALNTLTKLTQLDVSHNHLHSLPKLETPELTALDVSHNMLAECSVVLPAKLSTFSVVCNPLRDFPQQLLQQPELAELSIDAELLPTAVHGTSGAALIAALRGLDSISTSLSVCEAKSVNSLRSAWQTPVTATETHRPEEALGDISAELAAAVIGEVHIRGSELEGCSGLQEAARYASGWLKALLSGDCSTTSKLLIDLEPNKATLTDIVAQLDGLSAMCRATACETPSELGNHPSMTAQLQLLGHGTSIFIPGGFGTHSMLYRLAFCDDSRSTLTLSLLNCGGEAMNFHPWALHETKLLRYPMLSYKGISRSHLLSCYNLTIGPIQSQASGMDPRQLYETLDSTMQALKATRQTEPILMKPQRSLTSSWRCVMMLLRASSMSVEQVKHLKLAIGVDSVAALAQRILGKSPSNKHVKLVQVGARKVARSCLKAKKAGWCTLEAANQIACLLDRITTSTNTESEQSWIPWSAIAGLKLAEYKASVPVLHPIQQPSATSPEVPGLEALTTQKIIQLPGACPKLGELKQWLEQCRSWCSGQEFQHALYTAIELLCLLPVPPIEANSGDAWPFEIGNNQQEMITVVHDLLMVIACSIHCVKDSNTSAFRITIAVYSAAAILHHLACRHNRATASTKMFIVSHDSLTTLLCGDPVLAEASAPLHEHACTLLRYYDTVMGQCEDSSSVPLLGLPWARWQVHNKVADAKAGTTAKTTETILGPRRVLEPQDLTWHSQLSDFRKHRTSLWSRFSDLEKKLQEKIDVQNVAEAQKPEVERSSDQQIWENCSIPPEFSDLDWALGALHVEDGILQYKQGATRDELVLAEFIRNHKGDLISHEVSALRSGLVMASMLAVGSCHSPVAHGWPSVLFEPHWSSQSGSVRVRVAVSPNFMIHPASTVPALELVHPQLRAVVEPGDYRPNGSEIQTTYHYVAMKEPTLPESCMLISDELEHHLRHCWKAPPEARIGIALQVFCEHMELLDSEDFQDMLFAILFSPPYLLVALYGEPVLLLQLLAFCDSGISCFSGIRRLSKSWPIVNSGLLFFLRLSQLVMNFAIHTAKVDSRLIPYEQPFLNLQQRVGTIITDLLDATRTNSSKISGWMQAALHFLAVLQVSTAIPPTDMAALDLDRLGSILHQAVTHIFYANSQEGDATETRFMQELQNSTTNSTQRSSALHKLFGCSDAKHWQKLILDDLAKHADCHDGNSTWSMHKSEPGSTEQFIVAHLQHTRQDTSDPLNYWFDLSNGTVQRDVSTRKLLPSTVLQLPGYKKIFGEVRYWSWASPLDRAFEFVSAHRTYRVMFAPDNKVAIQILYEGRWYQLVDQSKHQGVPLVLCGTEFCHWTSSESLLITCCVDKMQVPYAVSNGVSLQKIDPQLQKCSEMKLYSDLNTGTERLCLNHFDHSEFTLQWQAGENASCDEYLPNVLHFPRYSLQFELSEDSNQLSWSSDTQFVLNTSKWESPFWTAAVSQIALLLCKKSNQVKINPQSSSPTACKILLPRRPFRNNGLDSGTNDVLLDQPDHWIRHFAGYPESVALCNVALECLQFGTERFFTYDYDLSTKELSTSDLEGQLYLLYIHLAERNYETAKRAIEKCSCLSKQLDQSALEILMWIFMLPGDVPLRKPLCEGVIGSNQDSSPAALALQLKLAAIFQLASDTSWNRVKSNAASTKSVVTGGVRKRAQQQMESFLNDFWGSVAWASRALPHRGQQHYANSEAVNYQHQLTVLFIVYLDGIANVEQNFCLTNEEELSVLRFLLVDNSQLQNDTIQLTRMRLRMYSLQKQVITEEMSALSKRSSSALCTERLEFLQEKLSKLVRPVAEQHGTGASIATSFNVVAAKDIRLDASVLAGIQEGITAAEDDGNLASILVRQFIPFYEQLRQGEPPDLAIHVAVIVTLTVPEVKFEHLWSILMFLVHSPEARTECPAFQRKDANDVLKFIKGVVSACRRSGAHKEFTMSHIFSPVSVSYHAEESEVCTSTTPDEISTGLIVDEPIAQMLRTTAQGSLRQEIDAVFGTSDTAKLFFKGSIDSDKVQSNESLLLQIDNVSCRTGHRAFIPHKVNEVQQDLKIGRVQNACLQEVQEVSASILNQEGKLEELHRVLQQEVALAKDLETNLSDEIEHLLNRMDGAEAECLHRLHCVGGVSNRLSVQNAIGLYISNRLEDYQASTYSQMSRKLAGHLFSITCQLLMVATRRQHMERVCGRIQRLTATTVEGEERQRQLVELRSDLVMKREYCVLTNRQLLAYEYFADITLREKQTQILLRLLKKGDTGFENLVQQLIMGGGKTKVLLPLLAQCKAEGDNLVLIVVPLALQNTTFTDLQISSYDTFGQTAHLLECSRSDHASACALEQLRDNLWSWIIRQDYVVTTEEAVQSLELSLVESLEEAMSLTVKEANQSVESGEEERSIPSSPVQMSAELQEEWHRVSALSEILRVLRLSGDALIDEVDSILDCRHELNFTFGEPEPVDPNLLKLLSSIYGWLDAIEIPNFQGSEACRVGNLLHHDTQTSISEEQYLKHVLPQLAQSISNASFNIHLANVGDEQILLSDGFDSDALVSYLSGEQTQASTEAIQEVMTRLTRLADGSDRDLLVCNLIALSRHMLCELMPALLQRTSNVHFGMSHSHVNHYTAIPYVSSNTPREGSSFGSPFETYCYTLQYARSNNLSTPHCHALLCEMQRKVEADAELSMGLVTTLVDDLNQACGLKLLNLNPSSQLDLQTFESAINKCRDWDLTSEKYNPRDSFLELLVIPQVREYTTRICSNSQNLVSMFRSVQGFSGTPAWNCDTYSESLLTELDAGTDGRTIDRMLQLQSSVWMASNNLEPQDLLASMLGHAIYNAIIDVGAFFKGIANENVALLLTAWFRDSKDSSFKDIRKVLFFNSNDQLCALSVDGRQDLIGTTHAKKIEEQTGCTPKQLFTYYDQRHTTGTDIQQSSSARALVTLDESTYMRDLVQGVMRLRLLGANQAVDYVIKDTLLNQSLLTGPVDVQQLLCKVLLTQATQQAENNMCAVIHKFHNLTRAQVLAAIQDERQNLDLVKKLMSTFQSALVHSSGAKPFEKFSVPAASCASKEILHRHYTKFVSHLPHSDYKEMQFPEAAEQQPILRLAFSAELDAGQLLASLLKNVENRFPEAVNGYLQQSHVLDVQEQIEMQTEMQVETQMQYDAMMDLYRGDRPALAPLRDWWCDARGVPDWLRWDLLSSNCRKLQRLQSATANNAELGALKRIAFDDYIFISNRLQSCVLHRSALLSPFQKYAYHILIVVPPTGEIDLLRLVMLDTEEATYVERQIRQTWDECTSSDDPSPQRVESCFMALVSTDCNIIQRGFCFSASMVQDLGTHDRFLRGMEQIHFLNGDIHLLARRIVQGYKPSWVSHRCLEYMNGKGTKPAIQVNERRSFQRYFEDAAAFHKLLETSAVNSSTWLYSEIQDVPHDNKPESGWGLAVVRSNEGQSRVLCQPESAAEEATAPGEDEGADKIAEVDKTSDPAAAVEAEEGGKPESRVTPTVETVVAVPPTVETVVKAEQPVTVDTDTLSAPPEQEESKSPVEAPDHRRKPASESSPIKPDAKEEAKSKLKAEEIEKGERKARLKQQALERVRAKRKTSSPAKADSSEDAVKPGDPQGVLSESKTKEVTKVVTEEAQDPLLTSTETMEPTVSDKGGPKELQLLTNKEPSSLARANSPAQKNAEKALKTEQSEMVQITEDQSRVLCQPELAAEEATAPGEDEGADKIAEVDKTSDPAAAVEAEEGGKPESRVTPTVETVVAVPPTVETVVKAEQPVTVDTDTLSAPPEQEESKPPVEAPDHRRKPASESSPIKPDAKEEAKSKLKAEEIEKGERKARLKQQAQTNDAQDDIDQNEAHGDYRGLLMTYFSKHNPDKLSAVDKLLQIYKGRETELFQKLETKYNASVHAGVECNGTPECLTQSSRQQPVANTNASRSVEAPATLSDSVAKSPSTEPCARTPPDIDFEATVRHFFELNNPSKLSSLPKLLSVYKGRETTLLDKLQEKYNMTVAVITQDGDTKKAALRIPISKLARPTTAGPGSSRGGYLAATQASSERRKSLSRPTTPREASSAAPRKRAARPTTARPTTAGPGSSRGGYLAATQASSERRKSLSRPTTPREASSAAPRKRAARPTTARPTTAGPGSSRGGYLAATQASSERRKSLSRTTTPRDGCITGESPLAAENSTTSRVNSVERGGYLAPTRSSMVRSRPTTSQQKEPP